jgi:hypothetical protein
MPTKRSKTSRLDILSTAGRDVQPMPPSTASGAIFWNTKPSRTASARNMAGANGYLCALERNQNGKYNVRVRAIFAASGGDVDGGRTAQASQNGAGGWTLPVYFLASSFNAAMKKLEESLQLLQKNEERLRFWGVERTDDPNLAGELLQEFGLWLDRRREFPRKIAELGVPRERPVSASMLAQVRRVLAASLAQARPAGHSALASD